MNLLPHQAKAVDEYVRRDGRMLLWADTGTGKTAIAIEGIRRVNASRVLFLVPAILKEQVAREFAAWWPEASVAVVQGTKPRRKELWASEADVWIANYEQLLVDFDEILGVLPDMIVADECQRLCSPSTKTIKAFRKLNPKYRLAMSGTPAPNALHEFWNMADWVSPGIAHESFWQFRARECRMHPAFPKILGFFREDQVKKTFMSVTHRITRSDAVELPPLTEVRIPCRLSKEQQTAYDTLKRELSLEIRAGERLTVPNMLALIMRLRQMADLPETLGLTMPSSKVARLEELLDAISSRKILVFTEFASVACFLQWKHRDDALAVMGETPQGERDRIFERFRKDPGIRLLYLTSAAQYGVNLQEADTVISFDLPWNDARLDQRVARAWRYGQKSEVTSYRIVAEGTVDEKMEKLILSKRKATVDELRDFFT